MSQDAGLSRKEKKSQRDAERRGHSKKRKLAETLDEDDDNATLEQVTDKPADPIDQGRKDGVKVVTDASDDVAKNVKPKSRKKRKTTDATTDAESGAVEEGSSTKARFILFIGNLPFSTTDTSLQTHFQKLSPFTLRHRTDPKTKKSKGFAFLEFENYDRMKTCLKIYHHSMFDPDAKENGGSGKGNGKGGRRINVELTAGGGGKTENRKEKIRVKNTRLEEQRKRRSELELKEKAKKAKKEGVAPKEEDRLQKQQTSTTGQDDAGEIHPSRLAMMRR